MIRFGVLRVQEINVQKNFLEENNFMATATNEEMTVTVELVDKAETIKLQSQAKHSSTLLFNDDQKVVKILNDDRTLKEKVIAFAPKLPIIDVIRYYDVKNHLLKDVVSGFLGQ